MAPGRRPRLPSSEATPVPVAGTHAFKWQQGRSKARVMHRGWSVPYPRQHPVQQPPRIHPRILPPCLRARSLGALLRNVEHRPRSGNTRRADHLLYTRQTRHASAFRGAWLRGEILGSDIQRLLVVFLCMYVLLVPSVESNRVLMLF